MALCEICHQEMKIAGGCLVKVVSDKDGDKHVRIPVGGHGDFLEGVPDGRCHDCNAKFGEMHHWGCDAERCPVCGGQLISCDCGIRIN